MVKDYIIIKEKIVERKVKKSTIEARIQTLEMKKSKLEKQISDLKELLEK